MASEDYIPLGGEDEQNKVIDEVTDTQLECENNDAEKGSVLHHGLELLGNTETDREMQSVVEKELVTDQGVSVENIDQEQTAGEGLCSAPHTEEVNITRQPSDILPPPEVVGVNLSEVSKSVPKTLNEIEIRNGLNEIENNENRNDSIQSSAVKMKVENTDVTFLYDANHSETAPDGSNKIRENIISAEAKHSKESEKKETVKPKSVKAVIQVPSTDDKLKRTVSWDVNVLLVGGLSPGDSGDLKQLLNTALGVGCHRIKPRQKGDKFLHVHFISKEEMDIARTLLHGQIILGSRLTAVVESCQQHKRKAEKGDEANKPSTKKMKQDPLGEQFPNRTYRGQIAAKTEDVHIKLHHVAKVLGENYPQYNGLISQRQLKNGGLICTLNKFKECPPSERFANRCKFSIGTDEETGRLVVGFRAGNGHVNKVSSVKHNIPAHVIEAAKVFEKAIHASEEASEDPEGRYQYQFWHELIIRTNQAHDLLFLVFVHCPQDLAAGRMERLNKQLKEFFENGEGKKCGVVSLYTKVTYTTTLISEQLKLVMGPAYLEETVLGLTFHILPTTHFWNSVHTAKMICKGVEELLAPTKKTTVLEVGFGLCLVGLYLSRVAGQVLSVGAQQNVEEIQKIARLNKITNYECFSDRPEKVLHQVAAKISCDKACVVVTCIANRTSATICANAMEELRKIEKVRRLVLVTEMFKSRFGTIMALCNPTTEKGMGNPFFPMRAIPVDMIPNSRGYVLMILMERIRLLGLPKTLDLPVKNPGTGKDSDICRGAGNLMPFEKETREMGMRQGDARLTIISRREERELLQQREEKRPFRTSGRHRFAGSMLEEAGSYRQYQVAGEFQRPCSVSESSVLEEYHLRELKAEEEQRRQTEEEKQRRWIEKEEQRRWMEEEECRKLIEDKEGMRWREEKELKRRMEEEEMRKRMEEERGREFVRTSLNLRSRNDVLKDLITDTLREAAIPQLSADSAQKLKQLIAEAIRSVGEVEQEKRCNVVSTSKGVSGISPRDITVSQFGRTDKGMPESRYFKGHLQHIREGDSMYRRRYDVYGGTVGASERYKDKYMPHRGHFVDEYSMHIMEGDSLYQHRYSEYGDAVGRDTYQHNDLKPQHSVFSRKEVPFSHINADPQPPKLREHSGVSNNNASLLEGGDSYVRHVYHPDSSTSVKQEQMLDSYARHDHLAGDYARNEHQPSQDTMPLFHSHVEQDMDSYMKRRPPDWHSLSAEGSYIPFYSTRKQMTCSTPKPPGTEEIYRTERSNCIYRDSAPQATTSSGWQGDTALYLGLENKDTSQDYRSKGQHGQGQDGMHYNRYFM